MRHGESEWNKQNRFTGWTDVDLTPHGIAEAREAGELLKKEGFHFDIAHTSFLIRAEHTLHIVLEEMGLTIPVKRSWRLNERHYGALQGLNKSETTKKYGVDVVLEWRRSWDIRPPALSKKDTRWPGSDPKYKGLAKDDLPRTESLEDCTHRAVQYWYEHIVPELQANKSVLVVASGNTFRGLIKMLDRISNEEITQLNIPTGVPLVYELDEKNSFWPIRHYYLGSASDIAAREAAVKHQTDAR